MSADTPLADRLAARPLWLQPATIAAAMAAGAAAIAATVVAVHPALRAQRVVVLATLLALPLPLAVFHHLATPEALAVRRALGEPAAATLATARRELWRLVAATLATPLGGIAVAWWYVAYPDPAAPDAAETALGAAALTGQCVIAAAALAISSLASALGGMGSGRTDAVASQAAGVYGPAYFVPVLYAPTLGVIGALLSTILPGAWWGAAGAATPVAVLWISTAATAFAAVIAGPRALDRAAPHLHRAWLRTEEALATPFALDRSLPQPPRWLAADAATGWAAQTYVRRALLPLAGPALLAWAIGAATSPGIGGAVAVALAVAAGALRPAAVLARESDLPSAAALLGLAGPIAPWGLAVTTGVLAAVGGVVGARADLGALQAALAAVGGLAGGLALVALVRAGRAPIPPAALIAAAWLLALAGPGGVP